jgi:hypothetical protein
MTSAVLQIKRVVDEGTGAYGTLALTHKALARAAGQWFHARVLHDRERQPRDVVAFLASNDARWITGRTILTDGGRT